MKTLLLFVSTILFSQLSYAKDDRFRCRATGAGGREAELRFEPSEPSFRAKWEINLGQGQDVGTVVNVAINGVAIGGIVLGFDNAERQLEGDFRFDGADEFPVGFPRIVVGTPAQVGGLKCVFRRE